MNWFKLFVHDLIRALIIPGFVAKILTWFWLNSDFHA